MLNSNLNIKEGQDSLNSSEQQNTPDDKPVGTLYSEDEGIANNRQPELSQKDFNDTKSEQLLHNRLSTKKSHNRNSLNVTQNLYDMNVHQAHLTDQNIENLTQERAIHILTSQK